MLLRFALPHVHGRSRSLIGIFHGVYAVYCARRPDFVDEAWLLDEIAWFNIYLPAPEFVDGRAVFWFRSSAGAPLTHIWSIVRILERNGVPVRAFRTHRPGIVVYQDDYQVAAVPWRDTFAERIPSQA